MDLSLKCIYYKSVEKKIPVCIVGLKSLTLFFICFTLEFVPKPIDKYSLEERQQFNVTSRIFHFQPAGVYAYIQVCILRLTNSWLPYVSYMMLK
jgi:hypothetical protein